MGLFKKIGKALKKAVQTVAKVVSTVVSKVPLVGGAVSGAINRVFGLNNKGGGPTADRQGGILDTAAGTSGTNAAALATAIAVRGEQRPSPQPVPDPVPKAPFQIPAGDPKLLPGTKPLDQNPERYKEGPDSWRIQAEPQIVPLTLTKGRRPELKPVLWADGVVVKIGDEYICSKKTLADIMNSANPHYDIAENGRVLNRPMGRSVPILQVDITKLKELGDQRDRVNRYAGVKSVDYVNESEPVPGTTIPQGLLDQINWTLVDQLERYPDRFEVYDILAALEANYSVEALLTNTTQEDGKLDKVKLEGFLMGMNDRLKLIRSDFNFIKQMFYNGQPPAGAFPTLKYTKVARTINPEDEESRNSTVIKTAETVGVQELAIDKAVKEFDKTIKGVKGDLGELKSVTNPAKTGAGDQKAALIAKWQSYKWTVEEADYLKRESVRGIENPPDKTTNTHLGVFGSATILTWLGYTIGDKIVGFNHIRWTPAMEVKAGIVVPLPKKWGSRVDGKPNPILDRREEESLIKLFGTPPGYDAQSRSRLFGTTNRGEDNVNELWWMEQNAKRQAEIIRLAYDIRNIELATGKKIPPIQPPGVSIGGSSLTLTSLRSLNSGLGGRTP